MFGNNSTRLEKRNCKFLRVFFFFKCSTFFFLLSSIKFIKQASKDSEHFLLNKNGEFNSALTKAIYDLVSQFLKQKIRKESVLQVFSEIAVGWDRFPRQCCVYPTFFSLQSINTDVSSAILDVLNNVDCETSVNTDGMQDERLLFWQLLKDLVKIIPENLIKERLEIDTLQDAGIVKHRLFYSKFIKIKTKL